VGPVPGPFLQGVGRTPPDAMVKAGETSRTSPQGSRPVFFFSPGPPPSEDLKPGAKKWPTVGAGKPQGFVTEAASEKAERFLRTCEGGGRPASDQWCGRLCRKVPDREVLKEPSSPYPSRPNKTWRRSSVFFEKSCLKNAKRWQPGGLVGEAKPRTTKSASRGG